MYLPHLFERNASAFPDAVAITSEGQRITYRDLNRTAEQIAKGLREAGVGEGCLVGVLLDRSPEMVAGLLGIWKAGGAYLPLDPAAPTDHIAFMLEDAAPPFVLIRKKDFARAPGHRLLDLDDLCAGSNPSFNETVAVSEDRLAYVIYTSGSTGKPKGVGITHRGLANTVLAVGEDLKLGLDDIVFAGSTIAFDVACLELFLPLAFGAGMYLVAKDLAGDASLRLGQVHTSSATVMMGTPTMYRLLLEAGWQGNARMQVVVGGEVLPLSLATRLAGTCRAVWNQYGPSETAICATRAKIEVDVDKITIGRPLLNVSIHLLDHHLQPVTKGSMGEIYIGGVGVAPGYLHRPALNQARFLPDPFSAGRLFRSGDLAVELADGRFDFLGRYDDQVKVRGFRIELGEIESALRRCDGVQAAVVRAIDLEEGDRRLVAFVIGDENFPGQWKQSLQRWLPHYMVPAEFVPLPSFPTTPSGKVDVQALDNLRLSAARLPVSGPSTADPVEARLEEIWQRLLKLNTVGLDRDFFALGGHSLLAARMLTEVEQWFGSKLPHSVLVEHPTIHGLATYLRQSPAGKWPALVTIQRGAFLPPLFIAHGLGGSLLTFVELANALGPEQPVYGLQLPAFIDEHQADLRILAANFVKQLRAIQPAGPYNLAGHSSGGLVVFEMACQIMEQGDTVGLLALLDCDPNIGKVPHRPFKDWHTFKTSLRRLLTGFKMREFLARRLMHHRIRIRSWLAERSRRLGGWIPASLRGSFVSSLVGAEGFLLPAIRDYQLRPYPGNATLFIAQNEPRSVVEPERVWTGKILGVCETETIPGNHQTMLARPHVTSLAREIRRRLARNVQPSVSGAVDWVLVHEKASFTKLKHASLALESAVATAPTVPSDGDKSCSFHG
jgi:amino acid adenylation domain-containing protein